MSGITVRTFSLAKDGAFSISKNFKIKEFACKDGSDTIFISPDLVAVLQDLRDHFKQPVTITSGYRNDAYNKKIKGATYSMHKYGAAADIKVKNVPAAEVQDYLDNKYPNIYGIGRATTYTHIDVRPIKARWTY